jgi:hypothetical protein
MSERKAGYEVHLLDNVKLTEYMKSTWQTAPENAGVTSQAIALTKKGVAVIISEGVGWYANDDDTFDIQYTNGMGYYYMTIPVDVVMGAVSAERVELRDFVRSFGSRLDNNCWLWQDAISNVEQKWEVMV